MARVTRMAFAYDDMKSSSIGYENSKYSYPVMIIPGANHASFLSGDPPQKVKDTDLRALSPFDQIKDQMSDVTAAFIMVTREGKNSEAAKTIDYYIDDITSLIIEPILKVFAEEGTPFLSSFTGRTDWVEKG